jgi:hypothetical protein
MTVQDIISEIPRLTLAERVSVLEMIAKSLKAEVPASSSQDYRGASVAEVLGIIKFPDGHIPDDKEVDELRFQALQEKYLR